MRGKGRTLNLGNSAGKDVLLRLLILEGSKDALNDGLGEVRLLALLLLLLVAKKKTLSLLHYISGPRPRAADSKASVGVCVPYHDGERTAWGAIATAGVFSVWL